MPKVQPHLKGNVSGSIDLLALKLVLNSGP